MTAAWQNVETNPPPKDQLIEVTSGVLWAVTEHLEKYQPLKHRTWNARGALALAIWTDTDGGQWVDPTHDATLPPFKFWRPFDNPLADGTPATLDHRPEPIYQVSPSNHELAERPKGTPRPPRRG